jgi:hypothetical protein
MAMTSSSGEMGLPGVHLDGPRMLLRMLLR